MFLLLVSLVSLALSATPADVAEVKAYITGAKSCQGIKPLTMIGDETYAFFLFSADAVVNGVPTDELRVNFSVPICGFSGGVKSPPTGWPTEGVVEDLGWNGIVDSGTVNFSGIASTSLDFQVGSPIIEETKRAMWQRIYDRAIDTVIAQCHNRP